MLKNLFHLKASYSCLGKSVSFQAISNCATLNDSIRLTTVWWLFWFTTEWVWNQSVPWKIQEHHKYTNAGEIFSNKRGFTIHIIGQTLKLSGEFASFTIKFYPISFYFSETLHCEFMRPSCMSSIPSFAPLTAVKASLVCDVETYYSYILADWVNSFNKFLKFL